MQYQSDQKLFQEINLLLNSQPISGSGCIHLEVNNGHITLTGFVADENAKDKTEEVVKSQPGVVFVDNYLQVRGENSESISELLADSALTAVVKARLFTDNGISSFKIHVVSNQGVVTLTGATDTREQSRHAEEVVLLADNVKGVVNNLTCV